MMVFIAPAVGTGTKSDPRRPKHVRELGAENWTAVETGLGTFLVAAEMSPSAHATVAVDSEIVLVTRAAVPRDALGQAAAVVERFLTEHGL